MTSSGPLTFEKSMRLSHAISPSAFFAVIRCWPGRWGPERRSSRAARRRPPRTGRLGEHVVEHPGGRPSAPSRSRRSARWPSAHAGTRRRRAGRAEPEVDDAILHVPLQRSRQGEVPRPRAVFRHRQEAVKDPWSMTRRSPVRSSRSPRCPGWTGSRGATGRGRHRAGTGPRPAGRSGRGPPVRGGRSRPAVIGDATGGTRSSSHHGLDGGARHPVRTTLAIGGARGCLNSPRGFRSPGRVLPSQ